MTRLHFLAAFAASLLVDAALAAPVTATAPAVRNDLPRLLRERSHTPVAAPAPLASAVPRGLPLVSRRFDPDVTGRGSISDRYGTSLAVDGDTLLVGAILDTVNVVNRRGGADSGTVSVYRRVGGAWSEEAVLAPPTPEGNEQAGISVSLRADVAVAGARFTSAPGGVSRAGAAHVFLRTGTAWSPAATLRAPTAQLDARFGEAVATDGDAIFVGAPRHDTVAGSDAGAVYVFRRNGGNWPLVATVTAPDGAAGDGFGSALAIEGDVLFVGAPLDDEPGVGSDRGSVYAFTRSGDAWPFAAKTTAPGTIVGARFGSALALDATRLAVGAPGDSTGLFTNGRVVLYARGGSALSAPQFLSPPGGADGDAFGTSVALGAAMLLAGSPDRDVSEGAGHVFIDVAGTYTFQATLQQNDGPTADVAGTAVALFGNEALLGAPLDDLPPNRAQGSVQRYLRSGSTWSPLPRLDTGDGAAFEAFGQAVAATDQRIAIGAYLDDTIFAGDDAGSVTIYVRNGGGWAREARIEAPDAISQDRFGVSLALRDDELLAGSYFNVVEGEINHGAVYAFGRDAGGAWQQRQKLTADIGSVDDFFGFAIARDGDTLLVGAPGFDFGGADGGAGYIFRRGASGWTQEAVLIASGAPLLAFAGFSVALEGNVALLGAPDGTVGDNEFQGLVHVFVRNGANWQFSRSIVAPDGVAGDSFGIAVALDHGLALIGAPGADQDLVEDSGAVYAYSLSAASETLLGRFGAPAPTEGGFYGFAIALDRERALIGAAFDNGPGGELAQGRTWLASRAGTVLGAQSPLDAPTAKPLQFFGRSVALSFATLAVGAPEFQRDNPAEGAAYAFDDSDRLFRDGFE